MARSPPDSDVRTGDWRSGFVRHDDPTEERACQREEETKAAAQGGLLISEHIPGKSNSRRKVLQGRSPKKIFARREGGIGHVHQSRFVWQGGMRNGNKFVA